MTIGLVEKRTNGRYTLQPRDVRTVDVMRRQDGRWVGTDYYIVEHKPGGPTELPINDLCRKAEPDDRVVLSDDYFGIADHLAKL